MQNKAQVTIKIIALPERLKSKVDKGFITDSMYVPLLA